MAPRIRLVPEVFQQFCQLVDPPASWADPVAPLGAVNRTQITVLVCPLVPDPDAVFIEVADIGIAVQKPEQFVDDRSEVEFLGRDRRKTPGQVEPHLVTEVTDGPRAGTVGLAGAVIQDMLQKIQVGAHQDSRPR